MNAVLSFFVLRGWHEWEMRNFNNNYVPTVRAILKELSRDRELEECEVMQE